MSRRERGELEAHVLRVLWDAGEPLTAKQIQAAIPGPAPAHTTVLTALDRLGAKGHVRRTGDQIRNVRFAATRSEDEHTSLAMLARLESSRDREGALLRFAGTLDDAELDVLRRAMLDRDRRTP